VSVSVSNIYKDTAQALALVFFERTALMLIVNSPKEVNKLVREGNYAFGRLDSRVQIVGTSQILDVFEGRSGSLYWDKTTNQIQKK
jgi:hypothetical protein